MNEETKSKLQMHTVMCIIALGLCPILLVFILSIVPAVFEDIKDDIFLALGGNQNIWSNYYMTTKAQSALMCDILGNLMYWICYQFMIHKYEGDTMFPRRYQFTSYGFVLLLLIPTTI